MPTKVNVIPRKMNEYRQSSFVISKLRESCLQLGSRLIRIAILHSPRCVIDL